MNYKDFSIDDFVMDDYFQKWVMQPDPATCTFWEQWLSGHPEKRETVEKARQVLLSTTFETHTLPEQEFHQMWDAIREKTQAAKDPIVPISGKQREERRIFLWRNPLKMAVSK